jgi:hypothetical protein
MTNDSMTTFTIGCATTAAKEYGTAYDHGNVCLTAMLRANPPTVRLKPDTTYDRDVRPLLSPLAGYGGQGTALRTITGMFA